MPFSIKPMHHAPGRSTPRRGLVRYVGADIMQKMLLLMAVLTAEGLLMPNVACSKGAFAPTSRMASRARTFCQVPVEDVDAEAVEVEPVAKKAPAASNLFGNFFKPKPKAKATSRVVEEEGGEEPEPSQSRLVDPEQTRCSRSQRSSLLQTSACGRTLRRCGVQMASAKILSRVPAPRPLSRSACPESRCAWATRWCLTWSWSAALRSAARSR